MISASNAFLTALQAGAPQRWLFVWQDGTLLSNEGISVEEGVAYDETFCSETDLTVGLTPSARISFTMLNDQYQWDDFIFGNFSAWLGVRLSRAEDSAATSSTVVLTKTDNILTASANRITETYELVPFGNFHADRPNIVHKSLIDIEAFDTMTLFDRDLPSAATLGITYPVTAAAMLTAMCTYLGVTLGTSSFLNSDLTASAAPEGCSMREMLGWIAEAACAIARFDRSGRLVLSWFNRVSKSYDEHSYTGFERTRYATTPVNRLSIRNEDSTAEPVVIGSGSSAYMIQGNPFLVNAAAT